MKFSKLQATGNDFIVIDARCVDRDWEKLAQFACSRHFGIGADGVILVQTSQSADLRMRIFNADGREAETCGNGLRCLSKYCIDHEIVQTDHLTIETPAGIAQARICKAGDKTSEIEVSMGIPRFAAEEIPIIDKIDVIPILNYPLTVAGETMKLSFVSMGNPHAVTFTSQAVGEFTLLKVGPLVEKHRLFPQKINFEVARILARNKIEARIWERGVGETLSCGSGACAIAVAAQKLDYVDDVVDIISPGGILTVRQDRVGSILLAGPAEEIFCGEWEEIFIFNE